MKTGLELINRTFIKSDINNPLERLTGILIDWEQFKKSNWWDSESVDVEKLLMDQFSKIILDNLK